MCLDNQPYSIVDNQCFKQLMSHVVPQYALPSRKYFSQNIIPDIYSRLRNQVSLSVKKIEHISITSDIWTCHENNESFISLTDHWIDPIMFTKHNAVLNCEHFVGSHTGINISAKIKNLLESWNLEKSHIFLIIRDGGANIVKGCNDLGVESFSCFIHSLQLVFLSSLKSQRAVNDAKAVARKIVGHFSHSLLSVCDKLKLIRNDLNLPNKKLIQYVQTRWNSSFYMLERLIDQK